MGISRKQETRRVCCNLSLASEPLRVRVSPSRSLLETVRFTNTSDPYTSPSAVLLDPWGQPYVYAYKTQTPWNNASYVLYSAGPDGIDSPALQPGGFPDVAPAANLDNIHANR